MPGGRYVLFKELSSSSAQLPSKIDHHRASFPVRRLTMYNLTVYLLARTRGVHSNRGGWCRFSLNFPSHFTPDRPKRFLVSSSNCMLVAAARHDSWPMCILLLFRVPWHFDRLRNNEEITERKKSFIVIR